MSSTSEEKGAKNFDVEEIHFHERFYLNVISKLCLSRKNEIKDVIQSVNANTIMFRSCLQKMEYVLFFSSFSQHVSTNLLQILPLWVDSSILTDWENQKGPSTPEASRPATSIPELCFLLVERCISILT